MGKDDPVTTAVLERAFADLKEFMDYRFEEIGKDMSKVCTNDRQQDHDILRLINRIDNQEKKCDTHLKKKEKESKNTTAWIIVGVGWGLTIIGLYISVRG